MLSSSVANGFRTIRMLNKMDNTEETETFCSNFDKFFDICNTRSIEEGEKKRKPNLKPFYVKEDQRLEVKNNFRVSYVDHFGDSGWRAPCYSTWKAGRHGFTRTRKFQRKQNHIVYFQHRQLKG